VGIVFKFGFNLVIEKLSDIGSLGSLILKILLIY